MQLQTTLEQVAATCGVPFVVNGTNGNVVSLTEQMAPSESLDIDDEYLPYPVDVISINSAEEMKIIPDEPSSTVDGGGEPSNKRRKTRVFRKRNYSKVTAVNSKMVYDDFHDPLRERGRNIDSKYRISLAAKYNLSDTGVQGILNDVHRENMFRKHLAIIRCYNNGMTMPELQVKFPTLLQNNAFSVTHFSTFEAIINEAAQLALFASVRALHDKSHRLSEEKIDVIQAFRWLDQAGELEDM